MISKREGGRGLNKGVGRLVEVCRWDEEQEHGKLWVAWGLITYHSITNGVGSCTGVTRVVGGR